MALVGKMIGFVKISQTFQKYTMRGTRKLKHIDLILF